MKEKTKDTILLAMGALFLVWGLAATGHGIYMFGAGQVLWFCYLGLIILGIGILSKNSYFTASQVAVLAIPLIVWDIDFVYRFFTGISLFGITDYYFTGYFPLFSSIISLQHFFTVPLALYTLYLMKIDRFDFWKVGFIYVVALFVVGRISVPDTNINCVKTFCGNIEFGAVYPLLWIGTFFLMIMITTLILFQIPIFRARKIERKIW